MGNYFFYVSLRTGEDLLRYCWDGSKTILQYSLTKDMNIQFMFTSFLEDKLLVHNACSSLRSDM